VLHGEDERQPVIGRVIGRRLTDELGAGLRAGRYAEFA
jgi:hypothetical protein